MLAPELPPSQPGALPSADALDRALRAASPAEVIATALKTVGRERLALVSSFGTESAALLKVMADVDPSIPVIFLDTGWLFDETLAYRNTLIEALGLTDVRSIKPQDDTLSSQDPDRELWFTDPDACCRIRKVEPLARALKPFSAWINGRRGRWSQAEIQSVRQRVARGHRGDLSARQAAAASTCRIGLSVGRVYALQQPRRIRRGRARRPLAGSDQDGMRHPYDKDFVAQPLRSTEALRGRKQ
jgi:hypothetical protein